jgi:hypothetical protein
MISWGRESRDLLLFFTHRYDIRECPVNWTTGGRPNRRSSLNFELGVCFAQLSTFVTNCEQRKLSNSIGGGSLYGGRARPYDSPALQDAPSPFGRLAGPRWVNSEELLKSRYLREGA